MRKTSAALALATLIILTGPVVAHADDQYPPSPPSPAPVSTVEKTSTGSTIVNTSTGSTSALPSTGLSDAVVPIGIAGGVLALGGVALLASRRAARR